MTHRRDLNEFASENAAAAFDPFAAGGLVGAGAPVLKKRVHEYGDSEV